MVYNWLFVMSKGNNHTYRKEIGLVHHTDYDDQGRHSFDYNPTTGEVTRDHSVPNKNQHKKVQWPNSNLWDD